jgi:nucleoside phosphorylase
MVIDWAVFGERNGGHALLLASGNPEFAARITQYTDRPGDPPVGQQWGPVDSGFYLAEHYILLRVLPDPTAGRAGMVLSFAAYVPEKDLASVGNLAAVFDHLPNVLVKLKAPFPPLDIPDTIINPATKINVAGVMSLGRQLGSREPILPLVWASTKPYLPIVDAVWGRLPSALRPAFAFAFQFAPEHKLPVTPALIATLPELAGRWSSTQLITSESGGAEDFNAAQSWFAGISADDPFSQLAEYGIVVNAFQELHLFSAFADLITRLDRLSFTEASRAVRIVEKFSKTNRLASKSRTKLFAKLCELVSTATPEEIARLRNLDGRELDDLVKPLQIAIKDWLDNATIGEGHVANLELALAESGSWWSKPFIRWAKAILILPSATQAGIVCRLMASTDTSKFVAESLPRDASAEQKLIEGLPGKLNQDHADNILRLAEDRAWMKLHASCLLRSHTEFEAVELHAESAGDRVAGFQLLHEQLGFSVILAAACSSGRSNLVQYAGMVLHENVPSVSGDFAEGCKYWCSIVASAIRRSQGHVVEPLRALAVATLKPERQAAVGFVDLCVACIDVDASLWVEVDQPARILDQLPAEVKSKAIAQINSYIAAEISARRRIAFARPDDFRELVNTDEILHALSAVPASDAARVGVNAFRSLPFLSDNDCRTWLIDLFTRTHHTKLGADDGREIAALLLAANYPAGAEIVRETAQEFFRSDVTPIFEEIRYKYQLAKQPKVQTKLARMPRVIIATALPLERAEVIKWLGETKYKPDLFADIANWPSDAPVFEIWVLTTGAGNLEAQGALLPALRQLKPQLAFFLGVGGGVKDSSVGDVIYGTKVYYYEGGKEEDDGIKSRPVVENTSKDLVQLAIRVADEKWQPTDPSGAPVVSKATPAVIASGEKVLASNSTLAATLERIKTSFNDTQIVDMEAYGFMRACREEHIPRSLVIRGVSDNLANKAESDAKGNQPLAARNAAAFLFSLLRSCPKILKPKKKRKKILGIF